MMPRRINRLKGGVWSDSGADCHCWRRENEVAGAESTGNENRWRLHWIRRLLRLSGALLICVVLGGGICRSEDISTPPCRYSMSDFALSPDGSRIVELLQPSQHCAGPKQLAIARISGGVRSVQVIYKGYNIYTAKWIDRQTVGFVKGLGRTTLMLADVDVGRVSVALTAPGQILEYLPDKVGRSILYAYRPLEPAYKAGNWISLPIRDRETVATPVTNWGQTQLFANGQAVTSVAVWNRSRNTESPVYCTHLDVDGLAWVYKGKQSIPTLLRQTVAASAWGRSLIAISPRGTHTVISAAQLGFFSNVAGAPNGDVAVSSKGPPSDRFQSLVPSQIYVISGQTVRKVSSFFGGSVDDIQWHGVSELWAAVESTSGSGEIGDEELVEIGWPEDRVIRVIKWPNGSLEDCQINGNASRAVCVAETLTTSGRLVVCNLKTGSFTTLDWLGNAVRRLIFSFRQVWVRNRFGISSIGFLAVPRGRSEKSHEGPVPLAIMLYGFRRTYAGNAQWIRAYPVSEFVSSGIAVLLLNLPEEGGWRRGDTLGARKALLESPLSTVESAPAAVRRAGVDVGKVLVMGWSWGGFIAAHAIEDGCQFVAAEVGDPAGWNQSSYALGNGAYRDWAAWVFGGPPAGRFVQNYIAFDPVGSGLRPKGPVLLEFVSWNFQVGQMLEEMRGVGGYVEAFAYHHSVHYLNVPAEAAISRRRNLAWAKINLLGPGHVSVRALSALGLSVPPQTAYRCH